MKKVASLLAVCISSCLLLSCGESDSGPKRIVLGTDNVLYVPNDAQYSMPFVVQVTREDSLPAAGTIVEIAIKPIRYFKGFYTPIDSDGDNTYDLWDLTYSINTGCAAEDVNNNGNLEAGEDINNNTRLEPTYPGTVDSHPDLSPTVIPGTGRIVTNEAGFGYFVVTYPQSEANWTRIEITATADVTGTEENEVFPVTLSIVADELVYNPSNPIEPPGGSISRYGASALCTDDL